MANLAGNVLSFDDQTLLIKLFNKHLRYLDFYCQSIASNHARFATATAKDSLDAKGNRWQFVAAIESAAAQSALP